MIDFRYPYVLSLYFFMVLLALHGWMTRKKRIQETEAWGDVSVRERLFGRVNMKTIRWKRRMRWAAMALLIVAAAGPRIGTKLTEVKRKGVDILVALDVSSSMRAEDVKPTRLQKAKFEISRLISDLKGDRVGLVLFAGASHLYLPLTGDYDAAKLFLEAVDTDMIQTQGTALGEALITALSSFPEDDTNYRVLIVVTDGEDHEGEVLEMARKAAKSGVAIHTVGVGTRAGSLIPVFDENGNRIDYKKDRKGKLVTTTLNEEMLRELAGAGGGIYTRFHNRAGGMDEIVKAIGGMDKRTLNTHEYSQFEDRYHLFAAWAFLFFLGEVFIPGGRKRYRVWRGRFV
ncbi:MAG: VWA domain-containing protein [Fidelibacterota bacterium]